MKEILNYLVAKGRWMKKMDRQKKIKICASFY